MPNLTNHVCSPVTSYHVATLRDVATWFRGALSNFKRGGGCGGGWGDTATLRHLATPEELPASRLILLFTDENKYRMK